MGSEDKPRAAGTGGTDARQAEHRAAPSVFVNAEPAQNPTLRESYLMPVRDRRKRTDSNQTCDVLLPMTKLCQSDHDGDTGGSHREERGVHLE